MNRQEALEWAADYMDRYKIFEGGSLNPATRLEMISTFADSVVTPEKPSGSFADSECTGFIQACAAKMKLSGNKNYRLTLKNTIDAHCWHLAGQAPAMEPHPEHIIPADPSTSVRSMDGDEG